MIKYNGRDDRLDAFLGSVIEPAAAEYAGSMIDAAQNPQYSMPPELDKRCLERINGSSTSERRSLRTILIAAVIAALLGTSVFAVYNEVRQGLVMKREDVDEGSRITFVSTTQDTQPASYQTTADLVLGYIPEGFECIGTGSTVAKYADKNGNSFILDRMWIIQGVATMLNTEDAYVSPVVCNGYEGFKSIGELNGKIKISYMWYDTDKQMTYCLIALGIDENEILKIVDGMNYESKY